MSGHTTDCHKDPVIGGDNVTVMFRQTDHDDALSRKEDGAKGGGSVRPDLSTLEVTENNTSTMDNLVWYNIIYQLITIINN